MQSMERVSEHCVPLNEVKRTDLVLRRIRVQFEREVHDYVRDMCDGHLELDGVLAPQQTHQLTDRRSRFHSRVQSHPGGTDRLQSQPHLRNNLKLIL